MVRSRIDGEGALAGQVQGPPVQPRGLAPGAQGGEERLGPEVLMDVDGHPVARPGTLAGMPAIAC
jgi:hypothetical protein